jgi:predicted DNA-binding transcriptional regulator AlpA
VGVVSNNVIYQELNMTSLNHTAGPRYLTIALVCDKLSHQKSWLYNKVKTDPTFPRPVMLGSRQVFIESQIDEWVMEQAAAQQQRHPRTEFCRRGA